MIIGIDFDNTIIKYDEVFYKFALKNKLIFSRKNRNKSDIKEEIIKNFDEKAWTKLQGEVYSIGISQAKLYQNCLESLYKFDKLGHKIFIISHKTKYPVIGKKTNLHKITNEWIINNIFKKKKFKNFNIDCVFFNEDKNQKIMKILECNCNVFIDDLEDILRKLPSNIMKILFSKNYSFEKKSDLIHLGDWKMISRLIDEIS